MASNELNFKTVIDIFNAYKTYHKYIKNISDGIVGKKTCRSPNFPEVVSENLVKFLYMKLYNKEPRWNTKTSGDLIIKNNNKIIKLEVKAFSSDGPMSFGPTEKWNKIYFVDCRKFEKNKFTIYKLDKSNDSDVIKNLKVNKTTTFEECCEEKKRPRLSPTKLIKQLKPHLKKVFSGNINELDPDIVSQ